MWTTPGCPGIPASLSGGSTLRAYELEGRQTVAHSVSCGCSDGAGSPRMGRKRRSFAPSRADRQRPVPYGLRRGLLPFARAGLAAAFRFPHLSRTPLATVQEYGSQPSSSHRTQERRVIRQNANWQERRDREGVVRIRDAVRLPAIALRCGGSGELRVTPVLNVRRSPAARA